VWWREVKKQLKEALGKPKYPLVRSPKREPERKLKFGHLCERFYALDNREMDENERGRLFEYLFVDLLSLTFGSENVRGNHWVGICHKRQVDAAFRWQSQMYRVELKWKKRKTGPAAFDTFGAILDTAEVRGLFVSMSGYTPGAVQRAYELGKEHTLVLLDGEEIRQIFDGAVRLEMLLDKKLDFFQHTGNPYCKDKQQGQIMK
jgi:hypothetical protein